MELWAPPPRTSLQKSEEYCILRGGRVLRFKSSSTRPPAAAACTPGFPLRPLAREARTGKVRARTTSIWKPRPIIGYIHGKERVPLIDPNKRRGAERKAFSPAERERFKVRTNVERANAHLKNWLLPAQIFVHGIAKVSFVLMCSVLVLAALKTTQALFDPPPAET